MKSAVLWYHLHVKSILLHWDWGDRSRPPPRQKFSVTSVGVIFNQCGGGVKPASPPTPRQIECWPPSFTTDMRVGCSVLSRACMHYQLQFPLCHHLNLLVRPQEGCKVSLWVCLSVHSQSRIARKPQGKSSPNFCACSLWLSTPLTELQ